MTRSTIAALCLMCTTGCTFVPTAGTYVLSDLTVVEDGCNLGEPDESTEDDVFDLSVDEDALTAIADLDDEFQFSCVIDGDNLNCDDIVVETEGNGYSVDQIFGFGGLFLDEITLDGSYGITMECEGENCGQLAAQAEVTLPCTTTFDFIAETPAP